MMKSQKHDEDSVPYRRRGRPSGKNRVPLSLEERRARNAQYERERRNETADAMTQLAEAVGCDVDLSNADLLATAVSQLQARNNSFSSESIEDLMRINQSLESQIAMLQARLGLDDEAFDRLDNAEFEPVQHPTISATTASTYHNNEARTGKKQTKKRRLSISSLEYSLQPEKRAKTRSETSNDSGVELRSQRYSPNQLPAEHNVKNLRPNELLELPEEKDIEEDQNVTQAQIELQTELYNELYNSESQSSIQSVHKWDETSLSSPCMDSLLQSLIVVPPIVLKQQATGTNLELTQPEQSNVLKAGPPCDLDVTSADHCEVLPGIEMTLDFLTDNEKGLLANWLDEDSFVQTSAVDEQAPITNCDMLTLT